MAQAALREDTPLDVAEAARAEAALAQLPRELLAGAFAGSQAALDDCVARCVRGEPPERAAAVLRDVLEWRQQAGADKVRTAAHPTKTAHWHILAATRQPVRLSAQALRLREQHAGA